MRIDVQEKFRPQDYVATRDFALNFDDKKMKSLKVHQGEIVNYDGATAIYKSSKEIVNGPCHGLRAAIEVMGWLIPKNGKTKIKDIKATPKLREDYDPKTGGSFETMMAKEQGTVVASKKYGLIQEKDIVVKDLSKKVIPEEKKTGKLEVVGDQVAVREKLMIRSSTTEARSTKFNTTLIKGDESGSMGTVPLKMQKKSNEKAKNTYIVDETTPRNISEDLTMTEVQRMKGVVIKADDSQDAKIVGKVKPAAETRQVEGITFRKVTPRPEQPIKATVSRGGNESVQNDGVVVGKIKDQKTKDAEALALEKDRRNKAEAAKQARIKAASATQAMLEKEKPQVIKQEIVKAETTDYLSQLPDDWGLMHWVQKEKFIKALTDKGFIEFILSVETIKAVLNACTERLKELA
jgi:hypothetical protein